MSGNPSLESLDLPVVVAMKNAHEYWKQHKEEISDFDFREWCRNRWGFAWRGNPGQGTFEFYEINRQKYTEFMLTWQ